MKTKHNWQYDSDQILFDSSKTMNLTTILFYLSIINLLVIVAAPLSRAYFDAPGFLTFRIMLIAISIGMLFGIVILIQSTVLFVSKSPVIWHLALCVIFLGFIPPVISIIIIGIDGISKPLIHDITTDINDPPVYVEVKNLRQAGDNTVEYLTEENATKQKTAYPDITPIMTTLSFNDALIEATQTVKDLQWEFSNLDYENGIIEAYDSSNLFGFIDDIVIRVRQDGAGSRLDIRSSSRVGKGDLGKNAERISAFIKSFKS
jgi:uncharacterized protein (DUF1499 family)